MPPIATLPEAPSCLAVMRHALEARKQQLIVYTVELDSSSPSHPFGEATFARREHVDRFIEEVRKEEPELASHLRIEGAR
jgi:hypothetical protein